MLLTCLECDKRYSSYADKCPECACPTEYNTLSQITPIDSYNDDDDEILALYEQYVSNFDHDENQECVIFGDKNLYDISKCSEEEVEVYYILMQCYFEKDSVHVLEEIFESEERVKSYFVDKIERCQKSSEYFDLINNNVLFQVLDDILVRQETATALSVCEFFMARGVRSFDEGGPLASYYTSAIRWELGLPDDIPVYDTFTGEEYDDKLYNLKIALEYITDGVNLNRLDCFEVMKQLEFCKDLEELHILEQEDERINIWLKTDFDRLKTAQKIWSRESFAEVMYFERNHVFSPDYLTYYDRLAMEEFWIEEARFEAQLGYKTGSPFINELYESLYNKNADDVEINILWKRVFRIRSEYRREVGLPAENYDTCCKPYGLY